MRVSVVDDVTDDCKLTQRYACSQCWRHQHANLYYKFCQSSICSNQLDKI